MTYALEVKEMPGQAPVTPPAQTPSGETPSQYDAPAWSGDVYEEGNESRPEDSRWSFSGEGGEEAWLDRTDDGTITGWVRDPDGTVYRYSDPDAWAVEVDDAGLARAGGDPAAEGEAMPDDGADPNAETDPTAGDDFTDPDVNPDVDPEMEDELYDDYASTDEPADDETVSPDPDAADEPDTDEDDFKKRKRGKTEGKVLVLPFR